jgi:MFS family permease
MKPVLDKLPAERRTLFFVPVAAGAFVVAFLLLAILTPDIYYPMVFSLPVGIATAWALLGWPILTHKDGRPILDPKVKPYLFFPLAIFLALLLYPVLGTPLTRTGISLDLATYLSLALASVGGCVLAYLAVGFPTPHTHLRDAYRAIPPERRRHFFWPVAVVTFLVLYLLLGVLTTSLMDRYPDRVTELLGLQPLVLLPLCLLLATLVGYLTVGIPTPKHGPVEALNKVGGKARPRLFLATGFVLGIPFTAALGALLTGFTNVNPHGADLLPADALLPLAAALGFAASFGISAAVWGGPGRWRRYPDYEPGIPKRMRAPVFLGAGLAAMLAVVAAFSFAGLDIFYGLLAGLLVGTLVTLALWGVLKRVLGRREQGLLPPVPDRQKPLILFPVWLGVALLLFVTLTYALPDLVATNLLVGLVVGLALALALLESRLIRTLLHERREARARRKAWKALRKQRLQEELAEDGARNA